MAKLSVWNVYSTTEEKKKKRHKIEKQKTKTKPQTNKQTKNMGKHFNWMQRKKNNNERHYFSPFQPAGHVSEKQAKLSQ